MTSLRVFAVTLFLLVIPAAAQEEEEKRAQRDSAAREKLLRAERLADDFARRFMETLDFEVVYREFFATDTRQALRDLSILGESEEQEAVLKQLSAAEVEQLYVRIMDLYYLVALYQTNVLTEEEESRDGLEFAKVYPPEIVAAVKGSPVCIFFHEFTKASCRAGPFFRTAAGVRQFIADANHVGALLRKYMPPSPFDSANYRAHVKRLEWNGRRTSVIREADDGEEVTRYEVYRELFVLNIVEEKGQMKVRDIPIGN